MNTPEVEFAKDPALKLNFLSHGTLESKNLEEAREFYTEFLGLEVVRTSPISLLIRLGGANTIAVVEQKNRDDEQMPMLSKHRKKSMPPTRRLSSRRRNGDCTKSANPCCNTVPTAFSSGIKTTIAGKS